MKKLAELIFLFILQTVGLGLTTIYVFKEDYLAGIFWLLFSMIIKKEFYKLTTKRR